MPSLQTTQDLPDRGLFRANITSRLGARPIENATVRISNINDPNIVIDEITTDQNGQTDSIELAAPPVEYSLEPNDIQPYSVYNIQVSAPGYETQNFSGAEILSGQTALQDVQMLPLERTESDTAQLYVIPPHTLYGEYPPKIPEDEIKDVTQTGEIVLSRVVIPSAV